MQIKFLNIYDFYDIETMQVQYELLDFWRQAIVRDQINFVHKAKVEFKDYTFAEYPDQEKLIKQLQKNIVSGYDADIESQFWVIGKKRYTLFEELYNDLAKTHHLMELTITPEDCGQ
jgi:hypothetical protein